jgi:hypothetical protein
MYTFAGIPIIAPVSFETDESFVVNELMNKRQERLTLSSQRWKVTFRVEPHKNASLLLHLASNVGNTFSFTVPQPDNPETYYNELTTTTTGSTIQPGATSITVAAPANFAVGRFFNFGNHTKLYIVTGITGSTIQFYPSLIASVPAATQVRSGRNVTMQSWYDVSMVRGVTFEDGLLADPGSITLIEQP